MRRAALVVALLALAGCTPAQMTAWSRWFARDPAAATAWAKDECGELCTSDWDHDGVVEPDTSSTPDEPDHAGEQDSWAPSGQCSQWYGTAMGVGFSPDEWPEVDKIMWAESRCSPSAYNSEAHFGGHASGLMQIIWPTWAGECGISDPFDPWQNLSCAKYLAHTYGWGQWSTS